MPKASLRPIHRRPTARTFAVTLTLLTNATLGGVTTVGIPVALDAAGLTKPEIALFFILNAAFAVAYNMLLVPRIRRAGYPRYALVATSAAIPIGVLLVRFGAGQPVVLVVGGGLLLLVSTIIPQVFGRIAAQLRDEEQEASVTRLRRVTVAGYIVGLVLYSGVSALGIDALIAAAIIAILTAVGASHRAFAERVEVAGRADVGTAIRGRAHLGPFVVALVLVALLKSADTLRGIYLPLYAVSAGLHAADVPLLFMASALLEFAVLPLLERLGAACGSAMTLVAISAVGVISFSLLVSATSYPLLLLSQVIYAIVGVGFQSTGLVLLGRTGGGGVGTGASAYTAVTQTGTVLGAVLPLLVVGYSTGIFVIAIVLLSTAGVLAAALRVVGGRW